MAGTTILNRNTTLGTTLTSNQRTSTTIISTNEGNSLVTSIGQTSPVMVGGTTFGVGRGKSVYDIAVDNGFTGTVDEYLQSLVGASAYQSALDNGFVGTTQEWLSSLKGSSAYQVALDSGFVGTEEEWLESLKAYAKVTVPDNGKILSNDGNDVVWVTMEESMNSNNIKWDLGEI